MTKTSELRIGNFVNFKNRNDIDYCTVVDLGYDGYVHIQRNFKNGLNNDDQPENISDITPIPLTEEWLVRFGFLRNDALSSAEENYEFPIRMGLFFLSKHTTMIKKTVYYDLSFPGSFGSVYKPIPNQCRFVHQLQNLYSALTHEELILKQI